MQQMAGFMGQEIDDHVNAQRLLYHSSEVRAGKVVIGFQCAHQSLIRDAVLRHRLMADPSAQRRPKISLEVYLDGRLIVQPA
jgi:hypothetical protein